MYLTTYFTNNSVPLYYRLDECYSCKQHEGVGVSWVEITYSPLRRSHAVLVKIFYRKSIMEVSSLSFVGESVNVFSIVIYLVVPSTLF